MRVTAYQSGDLCSALVALEFEGPHLLLCFGGQVEVPKDNRHRDRPIVQDIFAALDKFLGSRQSKLAY